MDYGDTVVVRAFLRLLCTVRGLEEGGVDHPEKHPYFLDAADSLRAAWLAGEGRGLAGRAARPELH